jgi:hypothetical protein
LQALGGFKNNNPLHFHTPQQVVSHPPELNNPSPSPSVKYPIPIFPPRVYVVVVVVVVVLMHGNKR